MRRSIRSGLVFVAGAILALLVTVVGTSAQQTPPPPPGGGTPVVGTPIPTKHVKLSHVFHVLTSKQKKQILNIIHKDKNVQKIVHGRHYKVSAMTEWVNQSAQMLGGVVTLRFSSPQTITGTFADLFYPCNATTYKRLQYKAKYADVTYVTISVDLKHKKVVGIAPLGYVVGKRVYKNPLAVPTPTLGAVCHS